MFCSISIIMLWRGLQLALKSYHRPSLRQWDPAEATLGYKMSLPVSLRACASTCVPLCFTSKTQVVFDSPDHTMLPTGDNSNKPLVSRYQWKPRSTKKALIAYTSTWLLKCHTRLNVHNKKIKLVIQGQIQS